ncbi:3-oxoacyl-[acyl-carrier protein] reductase [Maridesulfovibrio ferrireducens]|uniref:3-oxoacyl-[acyl-carrier protein] reductase n=1 Tax=Maridesulfovibrio ferrireducens TaxID=246191 RepID=A0A1G9CL97_9BACT|nr:SDR family NAD(P)-dependent oxidoreductase [Maridesulfovibrio ferrireducens]SDK52491.1 3-oxoacyl-[acyl-carrier protein] reductase [Maridesulfovibrio ferrireducens]
MIILIGASSDIGKQLLPMLLENDEVLGTTRNSDKLSEFLECKNFTCAELDLMDKNSINSFCEIIKNLKGNITLINLSSISIDKLFLGYSSEEWDAVLNINLTGGIKILQTAIPVMMRTGWGRIINVSSVVAQSCVVGAAAYSASKAAVTAMTRSLAHEYGRFGITANSLVLGYFDTGLIHSLDETRQTAVLERIPSKQFGSCKDIYYAIEHIIKSGYLNGSEITIDGGLM